MEFERGARIEVASREDGFVGSYYTANIIAGVSQKKSPQFREYLVEYTTLVTDDLSRPLREMVSVNEIRPVPPQVPATGFRLSDIVDVYDNDGWWVGEVTGIIAGFYLVYFETTKEEIAYSFDRVRVHQEWVQGKWIFSNTLINILA